MSGFGISSSVSVAVLSMLLTSNTSGLSVTVAVLIRFPVADAAISTTTVYVIELPVGVPTPTPASARLSLMLALVTGPSVLPVTMPLVTADVQLKLSMFGLLSKLSKTVARPVFIIDISDGPRFSITITYVTDPPGLAVSTPSSLVMERSTLFTNTGEVSSLLFGLGSG